MSHRVAGKGRRKKASADWFQFAWPAVLCVCCTARFSLSRRRDGIKSTEHHCRVSPRLALPLPLRINRITMQDSVPSLTHPPTERVNAIDISVTRRFVRLLKRQEEEIMHPIRRKWFLINRIGRKDRPEYMHMIFLFVALHSAFGLAIASILFKPVSWMVDYWINRP